MGNLERFPFQRRLRILTPVTPGTLWVGIMALICLMVKSSVRLGHIACAWPWTRTHDPSNFGAQTPCTPRTFHGPSHGHSPAPPTLGKVGGEGKRALGIFAFILRCLSQINSVEKAKWAPYHIVLELLTTILILTRKKYHLIETKPPLPLYLAIIKKKKPCNSVPIILHCKVMRN